MHDKSAMILESLYEAALRFRDYRLPELFCGLSRQPNGEPVQYPASCSPQAWGRGHTLSVADRPARDFAEWEGKTLPRWPNG
jgi:glycogen debranching enzyme